MPYVDAVMPFRGVALDSGWSDVPNGFSVECMNVLPFDQFTGRNRIGTRSPLAVAYEFLDDDDEPMEIQAIVPASSYVSGALVERVVVVAGGLVYVATPGQAAVLCSGQTSAGLLSPKLRTTGHLSAVQFGSKMYFADGLVYKKIDLDAATPTLSTWAGPAGVASGGVTARLMVRFGARIALSGLSPAPNNWFLSKVGDPETWTPGTNEGDPQAGDSSTRFGLVGAPIIALAPVGESGLLFGTADGMSFLTADPVIDSARMVELSRNVGVVGPMAWCASDSQTLYVLSRGGLYRITPNEFQVTEAQRITRGRLDTYFRLQSFQTLNPILQYDPERGMVWCWMSRSSGAPTAHLAYHEATDSFWPIALHHPGMWSPTAAGLMPAVEVASHYVAVGGPNGIVGWFDRLVQGGVDGVQAFGYSSIGGTTAPTDDEAGDQRIVSRIIFGPIRAKCPADAMVKDVRFELASQSVTQDEDWDLSDPHAEVLSADTSQEAGGVDFVALDCTESTGVTELDGGNAADVVADVYVQDANGGTASTVHTLDCNGGWSSDPMGRRYETGDTLDTDPTSRTYVSGIFDIRYTGGHWSLYHTGSGTEIMRKGFSWDDPGATLPGGRYFEEEVTGVLDSVIGSYAVATVDMASFTGRDETELGDLLPGRNDARRCRVRAGGVYVRLGSEGVPWAVERVSAFVDLVGPHRNVRGTY